jgi:hypothetical protein
MHALARAFTPESTISSGWQAQAGGHATEISECDVPHHA